LSICWYGRTQRHTGPLRVTGGTTPPPPWQADLIAELRNWKATRRFHFRIRVHAAPQMDPKITLPRESRLIEHGPWMNPFRPSRHALRARAARRFLVLPPAVRAPAEGELFPLQKQEKEEIARAPG